jgi:hypothetical protein
MKQRYVLVLLLLAILSNGCLASPTLPSVVIESSTPAALSSVVTESCLSVENDISLIQIEDNLILSGNESYILGSNASLETPLPTNQNEPYYSDISNILISPNHEKVAYVETHYKDVSGNLTYVDERLKVLLNDGKELKVDKWQPDVDNLIEWFDNDWLLISSTDTRDGTIILLNPVTNERRRISPPISDIYNLDPIPWYQSPNPLPIYNSSMSLMFYLRNSNGGMEYALYDLTKEDVLWSRSVHNPTNRPQWSPNQDRVLIAIPENSPSDFEFFSIDQDGQEMRLSDFSSVYRSTYIGGFYWSPNGQNIGFWLDGRDDKNEFNPRFAILDLITKQTKDYCIGQGGGPIFWSSSGNQVAFKIIDKDNPELWHTIVVDIQRNIAVKIVDQAYPVGWMSTK